MRIAQRMGSIAAAIALALVFSVASADAQVAADAGGQFVGKWTLEFEPIAMPGGGAFGGGPGGGGGAGGGRMGGPQVLDITVANSQLAATLTGGMGGPTSITNISKPGAALVLNYSMSMQGQSIPLVLTLTPDGTAMKAEMQIAGQFTRVGTATKE